MVTDCITAYDTDTGTEKWRFYTDGPVRFAPVIYKDKLYVASDDGYLYCLNTDSGALIRKFLAGPATNTSAGIELVWKLTGLPSIDIADPESEPEFSRFLFKALEAGVAKAC